MKCWNCGVEPMPPFETLGKGWFKCSSCKATYSDDTRFQDKRKKGKK